MARLTGTQQALEKATRVHRAQPVPTEQQLGLPLAASSAATSAEAELAPVAEETQRRGINRKTKDFVDYFLRHWRDPRLVLAETYSRPVEDLAKQLGCTKLEAFQLQQQAARDLMPYIGSKMPVAVDVQGKGMVAFAMVDPTQIAQMAAGEGEDGAIVIGGDPLPPAKGSA